MNNLWIINNDFFIEYDIEYFLFNNNKLRFLNLS